jgi:tRNA-Thr(GGU) m(6)t(6)A37 methyltransferase TsaA
VAEPESYAIHPVGVVRSQLKRREDAPKQGNEGAPDAWLEIYPLFLDALEGITPNSEVLVLTWFHLARRDMLKVHPRGDPGNPLTGVFATRSPDRPNPIGLHRVTVLEIDNLRGVRVRPLEAIDGTPIIDIKPVLAGSGDECRP